MEEGAEEREVREVRGDGRWERREEGGTGKGERGTGGGERSKEGR
jgi:hypothetical protein